MAEKFDLRSSYSQLVVQLYEHACEKIIEGYEIDFDSVLLNM